MKLQPKLPADKLLNHLIKTTKCFTCGKDYDKEFPECPRCEHIYGESLEQDLMESEAEMEGI